MYSTCNKKLTQSHLIYKRKLLNCTVCDSEVQNLVLLYTEVITFSDITTDPLSSCTSGAFISGVKMKTMIIQAEK